MYRANPGAIVVAIDPGHGGCLDWGVPNPYDNKVGKSEKADTLGIALVLKGLLEAQGITVVMTRSDDSAIAGDSYPSLGCDGPAWRDVNGDGLVGFGPGLPEATRTRDELSARIDLANLTRADLTISLHINAMSQDGVLYRIAATQTYYTDAFAWADASQRLASAVQDGVVSALGGAGYKRQDRGVDGTAPYLYFLKPAGTDPKSPRRNLLMPAILAEVGSVSLEAEAERLATGAGREAAAKGVYDGIAAFLANRPLAARIDPVTPSGAAAGQVPGTVAGDGPPFWTPVLPAGELRLRLTNTGTAAWPSGMRLAAGWAASQMPYLATAPASLSPVDAAVPALQPGESVELPVTLPAAGSGRQIAWITVLDASGAPLTDRGVPPLQLATREP